MASALQHRGPSSEEGVDSTELAAALLQILAGPVADEPKTSAPAETQAQPKAPTAAPSAQRKAAPGKLWITVGLGRNEVGSPRDLVDLLVEGAGIPARDVGVIDLGESASLVEVPAAFAQGLSPSGNQMETSRGMITVTPLSDRRKKPKKHKPPHGR